MAAIWRLIGTLSFGVLCLCGPTADAQQVHDQVPQSMPGLQRLLRESCLDCHSGDDPEAGLSLEAQEGQELAGLLDDMEAETHLALLSVLKQRSMPPIDSDMPARHEYLDGIAELEVALHSRLRDLPQPRTSIRRMNRFQYSNAIQDLFELKNVEVFALPEKMARDYGYYAPETGKMPNQLKVGSRPLGKSQLIGRRLAGVAPFPQDLRAENGFDNRGDLLSLSPLLMESFLKLSKSIVESHDFNSKTVGGWQEFFDPPRPEELSQQLLRKRIGNFLRRAFRREVDSSISQRYVDFANESLESGQAYTEVMKAVASAVIASPRFLYLNNAAEYGANDPLSEFALASRLSFFLWGSIPDAELLDLASSGELGTSEVLASQVQRMLNDPRSKRFCDSFPAQWLQLERIISSVPDRESYPDFYFAKFRVSMHMMLEPLLLFETLVVENRSILQLIHSDFSYRSELLSRWYAGKSNGSKPPGGIPFQRVEIQDPRQGGVITNLATMTMTSSPTETKPITRGAWLASVILNNPPEPPPADVPPLPEVIEEQEPQTIRERLSAHRENAACAGCHNQLDPLGFALENYDPVGRWRDQYNEGLDVDVSGRLYGRVFATSRSSRRSCFRKNGCSRRHFHGICFRSQWDVNWNQ